MTSPTDVAFSPAVKAQQERRGSRRAYAGHEMGSRITPDLAAFIATRDSLYLATASADGQPYIQHRGGPPGFLKVLDEATLGLADFRGNRQYITLGNLSENPKAYIFLMDYANRQRIKLWGTARVVEDDPALLGRLVVPGYRGRPERALLFDVAAWDANCPQHIPQKFGTEEVAIALGRAEERVKALEAEVARLRDALP